MKINTMYAEHTSDGINLYGSNYESQHLTVFRSTKNQEGLAVQIYGEGHSNEKIVEQLKERPSHNFIGWLSGPISMPISMEKVTFVD